MAESGPTTFSERTRRTPRRRRRAFTLVLALAVIAAVATAVILLTRGNSTPKHTVTGALTNSGLTAAQNVTFSYPKDWKVLTHAQLASLSKPALIGVRRKDGRGLVVLRRS